MKKIIAVMAALAVSSLSAFALDITVGARGNFNMGLGTSLEGDTKDWRDGMKDSMPPSVSWKEGGDMGGGFAVYANFGLLDLGGASLGVQPEVGMNFNNGYYFKAEQGSNKMEMDFYDTTIDIPVLVTFTYPVMDALSIGGGIGPYLSIPVIADGKEEISGVVNAKLSDDANVKASMNFGLAFDVNGAYKVGPGSIVLDLRYMMDLTPTKFTSTEKDTGDVDMDNEKIFTRRAFTIGLGYQMKF